MNKKPASRFSLLLDGGLLLGAFTAALLLKRGVVLIDRRDGNLLLLIVGTWMAISLVSRISFFADRPVLILVVKSLVVTSIALAFLLTITLYILGWFGLSRFMVFGTVTFHLVLRISVVLVGEISKRRTDAMQKVKYRDVFILMQPLSALAGFLFIHMFHFGNLRITDEYALLFLGIFLMWFLLGTAVHRFDIDIRGNYISAAYPFWKSEIMAAGLVTLGIYIFNLPGFSRTVVLGSLLTLAAIENIAILFRFFGTRRRRVEGLIPYSATAFGDKHKNGISESIEIQNDGVVNSGEKEKHGLLKFRLMSGCLRKEQAFFDFLDRNMDLESINILKTLCLYTRDLMTLTLPEDQSLNFILNLEMVNNIRFVNRYFILVNSKLEQGGVLVGRFESLEQRMNRIYERYPVPAAKAFHFWDFCFNRVLSKLPGIRNLYFFLTEGKNRPLSKTECLGRLYYCGFSVLALQEIGDINLFIARKNKAPSSQADPSYGLLLKLPRVGRNGKIIRVFKIRTMHPYSEFIQSLIYEINKLEKSGKIRNDFRVTLWGSVFRKKWLDELPMIINWLKGDLKLFGIRPLSEAFFETYPEDLKTERIKVKPGLIPPYYVDMPDSIEDIWESERIYLKKYMSHPFRTDVSYLLKALHNIIFRGAKSA